LAANASAGSPAAAPNPRLADARAALTAFIGFKDKEAAAAANMFKAHKAAIGMCGNEELSQISSF
jgi:hypothetical protein